MLSLKVLIGKCLGTIDTCWSGTISIHEVASLAHEIFDLHMTLVNYACPTRCEGIKLQCGEICCLCSLGDDLSDSWSPQCSTDGSSRRSLVQHRRRARTELVLKVLLENRIFRIGNLGFSVVIRVLLSGEPSVRWGSSWMSSLTSKGDIEKDTI